MNDGGNFFFPAMTFDVGVEVGGAKSGSNEVASPSGNVGGEVTESHWLIGLSEGCHNSNNNHNTLKEVFLLGRSSCNMKTSGKKNGFA